MKKESPGRFEIPKTLDEFQKYLKERREASKDDFDLLVKNFELDIETLQNIRNEIREVVKNIVGYDTEYLSTTIHFRPRAINFLKLGKERIKKTVEGEIFHYPVYYQEFSKERPDIIDIGEIRISLLEIIPQLKNRKFKYSIDFHEALMEYLNKQSWEEELKKNLKEYLNRKFSNISKNITEIFINFIIPTIVETLQDYKNFFEKFKFNSKEEIKEFNSEICGVLLKNFDTLEKILGKLGITKEDLEKIQRKEEFIIDSDIIFLICILGGYIHIGAEYGKLNALRKNLGLKEIVEAETPQERFNLFNVKNIESGTLRFLFENPEPFIYVGTYLGFEEVLSLPIDKKVRERIRIVDFYYKLKDFDLDRILQEEHLNKEEFKEVLETVGYYLHLIDKEKDIIEKVFQNINDVERNLINWIEEFNKSVEAIQNIDNKTKNKIKIIKNIIKSKLLFLIYREYVEGLLINLNLPNSLRNKIITEFCDKQVLENMKNKEINQFGGILPKLTIPSCNEDDMIKLSGLFEIANKNFSPALLPLFSKIIEFKK